MGETCQLSFILAIGNDIIDRPVLDVPDAVILCCELSFPTSGYIRSWTVWARDVGNLNLQVSTNSFSIFCGLLTNKLQKAPHNSSIRAIDGVIVISKSDRSSTTRISLL